MRRDFPELRESPEMVETNVIASLCGPAQAIDPPVVAAGAHRVPVVKRIAPTLAGRAERIGRNTGDYFRLQIVLQSEQFAIGPHIGAVVVHKNRDVANYAYGALS